MSDATLNAIIQWMIIGWGATLTVMWLAASLALSISFRTFKPIAIARCFGQLFLYFWLPLAVVGYLAIQI